MSFKIPHLKTIISNTTPINRSVTNESEERKTRQNLIRTVHLSRNSGNFVQYCSSMRKAQL